MPVFELPKRLHPDFSTPGKKPIGRVTLKRSHRLAPRVAYFIFNDANDFENLVTGSKAAAQNASKPLLTGGHRTHRGFKTPTAETSIGTGEERGFQLDSLASLISSAATVIWSAGDLFKNIDNDDHVSYFWSGSGGSYPDEWPYQNGTIYSSIFATTRWASNIGTSALADSAAIWSVQAKTNDFRMARNGATLATSGAATFFCDKLRFFWDDRHTSETNVDKVVDWILVDNRRWSDGEIQALVDAPYQILKPAIPLQYFIPAAGGVARPQGPFGHPFKGAFGGPI